MFNPEKITIDYFVQELGRAYRRTYSDLAPDFGNIVAWTGRLALENIASSDALYHNVEHTLMVALAGQAIVEGKHLCEGGVLPRDWMHFMIALLCHDIGYVKGICCGDRDGVYATGVGDQVVEVPPGGTDVVLTPYHVDRSKLFVQERFGCNLLMETASVVDADVISSYIEMTRFPVPDDEAHRDTKGYGGLARAADFIGQLGDPNHMRKCPALFYEFEEIGANTRYGYQQPGDLRETYARFYWNVVSPYIQDALRYLKVTQEGKQWVANLYANVFASEHKCG
ncbi:MAG: metal-dependent phosphohydrolase [Anaerolineae bacterium]|nr:metal-dependent phosphohydrolase [Anaerolineae bacterium]